MSTRSSPPAATARAPSPAFLDRLLRVFTEVRAAEGTTGLIMLANIFLVLAAYYFIKPVREGWLAVSPIEGLSKVEVKAYSSFGQSLLLLVLIPLYAALAGRWPRRVLITRTVVFFMLSFAGFWLLQPDLVFGRLSFVGITFYLWVGIFSVTVVAQFWSFASDLYRLERGTRLFPLIAVGAASGAVAGSWLAEHLLQLPVLDSFDLLLLANLPLGAGLILSRMADRRGAATPPGAAGTPDHRPAAPRRSGAYELVFRHRYLLATAMLMVLVNWVVSNGENILFAAVQASLEQQLGAQYLADPVAAASTIRAGTTGFYSNLYFWVNLCGLLLQAFVVSRLLRYAGFGTLMLTTPLVSLVSYGTMAAAPVLGVIKVMKIAENSSNYSINNTARHVLWLPTTREMMYKAKAAVDTMFVRLGDGLAALTILLGTRVFALDLRQYLVLNMLLIVAWTAVAAFIVKENRTLRTAAARDGSTGPPTVTGTGT